MYLIFTFREFKSIHKGKTAILHLCFGTEKNRRLGSKKARYIRAFRRRHLFCLHIMSMGYKKDIFAVFSYEFELSHCYLSLSGIYRGSSSRPPGVQPSSDSVIFFLASFSFDCALASEIKSSILLYCFNTIPSSEAKVSR